MITTLIYLLVAALVLYLIYFCISLFVSGVPLKIVGIILALVLILYALRLFHFVLP